MSNHYDRKSEIMSLDYINYDSRCNMVSKKILVEFWGQEFMIKDEKRFYGQCFGLFQVDSGEPEGLSEPWVTSHLRVEEIESQWSSFNPSVLKEVRSWKRVVKFWLFLVEVWTSFGGVATTCPDYFGKVRTCFGDVRHLSLGLSGLKLWDAKNRMKLFYWDD